MKPEFTRGGRHKTAPYNTTHVRIPENLKGYVSRISNGYKMAVENGTLDKFTQKLNQSLEDILIDKPVSKNQLIDLAKEVLKLRGQKKSTKEAINNLLTTILGENNL